MQALNIRISIWTGVALRSLFSQNPWCSVEFATSHRCKPRNEAGIFIRTESAYEKIKTWMRDLLCRISPAEPRRQTSLWNLFRRPVTLSSTSPQRRVSPVVKGNELDGQVRRPISDEIRSPRPSVNQWESRIPLPRNFSTRSCPGGSGTRQVTWSVRMNQTRAAKVQGVVRKSGGGFSFTTACESMWVRVWPEVFRVSLRAHTQGEPALAPLAHTSNPLGVRFVAALHHKGCCPDH